MKKGIIDITYGTGRNTYMIRPILDSPTEGASSIYIHEDQQELICYDDVGVTVEYFEVPMDDNYGFRSIIINYLFELEREDD